MRFHYVTGCSTTLLALLLSCQGGQQTTTLTDSTTAVAVTPTRVATAGATALPEKLVRLGLTPNGHWRGISLGDPMRNVVTHEENEPFERTAGHVGYAVDLPNLESADVLYHGQAGNVVAIDVDLYLNSRASADSALTLFRTFFDGRYQPTRPDSVWTGPQRERITLRDVSKGRDYGLKIRFAQPGQVSATASAR